MAEIEDGRYRARGVTAALGRTSTGKEQVAVEFELLDAEGNPGPHITWFGYFTDATYERTIEALRHCGWEGDDLANLSGVDANEVSLVIKAEEYNGKWTPKVQFVNAPGGGGLALREQLSAEEARAFAAGMKGRILALKQGGPRKPTPGSAKARVGGYTPEPPPHGDDDMPF
jgi:hypothetical protein